MKLKIVNADFRVKDEIEIDFPFNDIPQIGSEVEYLDDEFMERVAVVKTIHYSRETGEPTVIAEFNPDPSGGYYL